MILIVAKLAVKPDMADDFPTLVEPFATATRSEPGCIFFEFSRSFERQSDFVLIEGFRDGDAGREHVESEHFRIAMTEMPKWLTAVPQIINVEAPVDGWQRMAEMQLED